MEINIKNFTPSNQEKIDRVINESKLSKVLFFKVQEYRTPYIQEQCSQFLTDFSFSLFGCLCRCCPASCLWLTGGQQSES